MTVLPLSLKQWTDMAAVVKNDSKTWIRKLILEILGDENMYKHLFPQIYVFTVSEQGNPHSPDLFLHVDKNECTSNLHLSWHLHFEAHTTQ
jgi:hypothetical protein